MYGIGEPNPNVLLEEINGYLPQIGQTVRIHACGGIMDSYIVRSICSVPERGEIYVGLELMP